MNQYLEAAVSAAKAAGRIQKEYLTRQHEIKMKGVANLVTEVDLMCEQAIIEYLSGLFPDNSFLAEESGETRPGSDLLWIIDPLDGTTNYAHSFPRFCVSIGLTVRGEAVAGVVFNPMANELFTGAKGEGAFLNGEPLRVSSTRKVEDALICTGFSYDRGKRLGRDLGIYVKVLPKAQSLRRTGCAALDICDVAAGRFDAFWEQNLNPWDVAAGSLILAEAGGRWSGLNGQPVDLYAYEFVGSNGLIHNELCALIQGPAKIILQGEPK